MLIVLGIIIVVIIIVIIICCFSFGIKDKNRNKKVLGGNALIFKGIENIGATCYFSSTLQILLHNKYFIKQINEILEYYTNTFALSLEDVEKIVPFTYLMSMIINRYYNSEDDSIRLNNINTKLVQCKEFYKIANRYEILNDGGLIAGGSDNEGIQMCMDLLTLDIDIYNKSKGIDVDYELMPKMTYFDPLKAGTISMGLETAYSRPIAQKAAKDDTKRYSGLIEDAKLNENYIVCTKELADKMFNGEDISTSYMKKNNNNIMEKYTSNTKKEYDELYPLYIIILGGIQCITKNDIFYIKSIATKLYEHGSINIRNANNSQQLVDMIYKNTTKISTDPIYWMVDNCYTNKYRNSKIDVNKVYIPINIPEIIYIPLSRGGRKRNKSEYDLSLRQDAELVNTSIKILDNITLEINDENIKYNFICHNI